MTSSPTSGAVCLKKCRKVSFKISSPHVEIPFYVNRQYLLGGKSCTLYPARQAVCTGPVEGATEKAFPHILPGVPSKVKA